MPTTYSVARARVRACVRVHVCVCVSSMQRARAIFPSVACPALQYFSTLSHTLLDSRKEAAEHKIVCFDFL